MSFTFDGIEIATEPATIVTLECGEGAILGGHNVQVGNYVLCEGDSANDSDVATQCRVVSLARTEMVPTVYVS